MESNGWATDRHAANADGDGEKAVAADESARQHVDPLARFDTVNVLDVEPLFDRVVIRIATGADKVGGVFLIDAREDRPQEGVVASVGPDCVAVKPGDRVIYARYSGTDVQLGPIRGNAPRVLVCGERDVLCRLNAAPPEPPSPDEHVDAMIDATDARCMR